MYNLASKLIGALCDPLALAIVLMVCALLVWKRRRAVILLVVAAGLLLCVFGSWVVAEGISNPLERPYGDPGVNLPAAQAIVVLGGAVRPPSGIHRASGLADSSDRVLEALRLYRAGKAPVILCSGGTNPIGNDAGQAAESVWMSRLLEEWGIPAAAVQMEGGSINTHENAVRSYQALSPRGVRRILLVTSAMHMRRAEGAFRKAGFEVIPAPADFHAGWRPPAGLERWLPSTGDLARSEAALHEWLGVAVYRARGWM